MENKPTLRIDNFGIKRWYLGALYHREDGPAVEFPDGHKEWAINGELHRLDGPAIEYSDGSYEWWINDTNITEEINRWAKENDIDLDNLTTEDIALIKLFWG